MLIEVKEKARHFLADWLIIGEHSSYMTLGQAFIVALSAGSVMQLLSALYSHSELDEEQSQLPRLIPRLFPFFRHTLSSVRKAAITCCSLLLSSASVHCSWLTAHILGPALQLTFQNLVVEPEQDNIRRSKVPIFSSFCQSILLLGSLGQTCM